VTTGIGNGRVFCAQTSNTGGGGNLAQPENGGGNHRPFRFNGILNARDCNAELYNPAFPNVFYRMRGTDASGNVICDSFIVP
jgi:hypothetical protein